MPEPSNPKLYAKIKKKVYADIPKHSAYRSGQLVKQYKAAGGTYKGKKDDSKGIGRWFKETPTTMKELTPAQKKKATAEKKATGKVKKYKT